MEKPAYPFDLPDDGDQIVRKSNDELAVVDTTSDDNSQVVKISVGQLGIFSVFKALTLPKLLEKILYYKNVNMEEWFLKSFRAFTTPLQVVELLVLRYHGPTDEFTVTQSQQVFFDAKKQLIQTRSTDLAVAILDMLEQIDFEGTDAKKLLSAFPVFMATRPEELKKLEIMEMLIQNARSAQKSRAFRKSVVVNPNVEQLAIQDVVWAITMKDWACFEKIRPSELVSLGWSGKHKTSVAPNVCAITDHFNWVTFWAIERILMGETELDRCVTLEYFIQVGMSFLEINNFNGVMQICCSLNAAAVSRLHATWELISEKNRNDFKTLEEITSYSKNSFAYRQALKKVPEGTPCLPYVGLFLTDITFAVTGNPAFIERDLVNINLVANLGKTLSDFAKLQTVAYTHEGKLCDLGSRKEQYGENELYQLSLLREPPSNSTNSSPSTSAASSPLGSSALSPHSRTTTSRKSLTGSKRLSYSPAMEKMMNSSGNHRFSKSDIISKTDMIPHVEAPTKEDFANLFAGSEVRVYGPEEVILTENERSDNLYLIDDGEVQLLKCEGKLKVMTLHKGHIFNVLPFVNSGCGAWGTVRTLVSTIVMVMSRDLAMMRLDSDPLLAARVFRLCAKSVWSKQRFGTLIKVTSKTLDNASRFVRARPTSLQIVPLAGHELQRKFSIQQRVDVAKVYTCKNSMFAGELNVTSTLSWFSSKVFGVNKKISIQMDKVEEVILKGAKVKIRADGHAKSIKFTFKTEQEAQEVIALFKKSQPPRNRPVSSTMISASCTDLGKLPLDAMISPIDADKLNHAFDMKESEWQVLLKGSKVEEVAPGTVLLKRGETSKEFFYLMSGTCTVQFNIDGEVKEYSSTDKIFGEQAFLNENQASSQTVIAEKNVVAYRLKSSFINIMLHHNVEIAPKFYHYLTTILISRLQEQNLMKFMDFKK